jgi:hypothetical protein
MEIGKNNSNSVYSYVTKIVKVLVEQSFEATEM